MKSETEKAKFISSKKSTNFHSIISLSGSLPSTIIETLNIQANKTSYLIFHGKLDDVVSYQQAIQTHEFLQSNKIKNKLVLDDNCQHSISSLALEEINKLYKNWL